MVSYPINLPVFSLATTCVCSVLYGSVWNKPIEVHWPVGICINLQSVNSSQLTGNQIQTCNRQFSCFKFHEAIQTIEIDDDYSVIHTTNSLSLTCKYPWPSQSHQFWLFVLPQCRSKGNSLQLYPFKNK